MVRSTRPGISRFSDVQCTSKFDASHRPRMTITPFMSLPRKYRLFQFGHAGIAPRQHFAELIDQGRRRRVEELAAVMKADHAPRAFGDRGEAEGIRLLDLLKPDAMHRGDLVGI